MAKPKPPAEKAPTTDKAKTPRATPTRRNMDTVDRVSYLRSTIRTAEREFAQARPGTIAKVQMIKVSMEARRSLDIELGKDQGGDPFAGLDEDELVEKLREFGEKMPLPHLRVLCEVWCEREKIPFPLRLVSRAETG